MSSRLVLSVALLGLTVVPLRAVEHEAPRKIKVVMVNPDPDLVTYFVGLLTRGPHLNDGTRDERRKIQTAQITYIDRLARDGKLLVAGPIDDHGDWRGLYIFKCSTLDEARTLAAADPEVKAGRLLIEVHPWLTEKGAIRDAEFAPHK